MPEEQQSGYRKPLREELRNRRYPVNMVGSRANGDFLDRQHEGWPGAKIDEMASRMLPIMTTQKPSLVLILLGTNDCLQAQRNGDMASAASAKDRMKPILEKIYTESPGSIIILASLPATREEQNEPYIQAANAGYRDLVRVLQGQGQKIESAEMYTDWLTPVDYSDGIHFNNAGYGKMAAIFADAFSRVEAKGWITAPIDTGLPDTGDCYPSPDGFRGPAQTQQNVPLEGDGVRFGDMYGRGYDE